MRGGFFSTERGEEQAFQGKTDDLGHLRDEMSCKSPPTAKSLALHLEQDSPGAA